MKETKWSQSLSPGLALGRPSWLGESCAPRSVVEWPPRVAACDVAWAGHSWPSLCRWAARPGDCSVCLCTPAGPSPPARAVSCPVTRRRNGQDAWGCWPSPQGPGRTPILAGTGVGGGGHFNSEFSASTWVTLELDGRWVGCFVCCGMFGGWPGLPPDPGAPAVAVTATAVHRRCQVSPGLQNRPRVRATAKVGVN